MPLLSPPSHHTGIAKSAPSWLTIAIIGIATAASALRATELSDSLWLDELHTAWTVGGNLTDIAPRAAMGNNAPLYFWGLWGWTHMVGMSELALRVPSLLAGWVTIYLAGRATHRLTHSPPAACLATLLLACDPHAAYFALEARPYALIGFGGLALTLLLHRLQDSVSPGLRLLYWFGIITLFWLHYTAALLVVAHAASLLVSSKLRGAPPSYRPRQYLTDSLWAAPCFLLALPHMASLASRRSNWTFITPPDPLDLITLWPLGYALIPAAAWLACMALARPRPKLRLPASSDFLPHLTIWLVAPLLVAAVATWLGWPIFHRRYLAIQLPAPPLLAAFLLTPLARYPRLQWTLVIAITSAAAVLLGPLHCYTTQGKLIAHSREDWRAALAFLQTELKPGEPFWLDAGLIEAAAWIPTGPDKAPTPLSDDQLDYLTFPARAIYPKNSPASLADAAFPVRWQNREIWQATQFPHPDVSAVWWLVRSRRPELATKSDGASSGRAADPIRTPTATDDHTPRMWEIQQIQSFGRLRVVRLTGG